MIHLVGSFAANLCPGYLLLVLGTSHRGGDFLIVLFTALPAVRGEKKDIPDGIGYTSNEYYSH